jgi:transcriptional regulator with XRE-family HTH domain
MNKTKQSFASRLAFFMKGETQQSLAKRARISQATVGRIRNGEQVPTIGMVEKLASALNIHPAVLLLDEETSEFLTKIQTLRDADRLEVFNFIQYLFWKKNETQQGSVHPPQLNQQQAKLPTYGQGSQRGAG